jgi:hypothetical protein
VFCPQATTTHTLTFFACFAREQHQHTHLQPQAAIVHVCFARRQQQQARKPLFFTCFACRQQQNTHLQALQATIFHVFFARN